VSDTFDWFAPVPDGATPLDADDLDALKLDWVTTRNELNLVERDNIVKALGRRKWRNPRLGLLLDDLAIRALHRDMFGDVWTWAGKYRANELNLGIDPAQVSTAVRELVDDAGVWLHNVSVEAADIAVCRLHHRLVQIHPFRNGNGRLARAYADLVLRAVGRPTFGWGSQTSDDLESERRSYLAALRAADRGDLELLRAFVRT
jgi:Fic-DOC domain mobile mystery protein B